MSMHVKIYGLTEKCSNSIFRGELRNFLRPSLRGSFRISIRQSLLDAKRNISASIPEGTLRVIELYSEVEV